MSDCEKVKECGREAYSQGLCLPHLKGWTPKRAAKKKAPAKKAASKPRSRSRTQTTEATGQTTEAVTEVTS